MGIAFNDNFGTIAYNGIFYPANSGGIVPLVIEGKKPMPFLIKTDINAINYNCNCIISNTPIDVTTYKGYFKYDNPSIKILEHKSNLVKFLIPIGINEVIINIKEGGNNNIVTKKYIIR